MISVERKPNRGLLAIVGPTGSGKSALGLAVAEALAGEIVNCDSLQLYRGFDVGAAKTPVPERRGIPHHLFDVLEPREVYSAGEYARHARQIAAAISARGRLPIVTGGTGFYLRALLQGLPVLPARDEALRARLTAREQKRPGGIHRLLRRLEPAAAVRIHERDVQKSIRALEVRILTRRPLPAPEAAEPLRGYDVLKIGLDPDRGTLHRFLDQRASAMFSSGLVEEVRRLLSRGSTGGEKPFESLGYKQALQYVRGTVTREQAVLSTQIGTRQYAKRQLTWFRRDEQIQWLFGFGHEQAVFQSCLELARKSFCIRGTKIAINRIEH
jgi:tRNA dimethylallyltransferase